MRLPSVEQDGWSLDDGEKLHAEFPDTFWIPSLVARQGLYPGSLVKLVFRMESEDDAQVERMWVVVTERIGNGEAYLGVLSNDPYFEGALGRLEFGFELPFEPRHVVDIDNPTDTTMASAKTEPARRWH